MTDADRQFWTTVVGGIVAAGATLFCYSQSKDIGIALAVAAAFMSYFQGRSNAKDIAEVHGVVNSRADKQDKKLETSQIDLARVTKIMALPPGPEKDRLMAEVNRPAEDLGTPTREAAAIRASHPATGGQPPHQGGAT
jgi:hypothetical protein